MEIIMSMYLFKIYIARPKCVFTALLSDTQDKKYKQFARLL